MQFKIDRINKIILLQKFTKEKQQKKDLVNILHIFQDFSGGVSIDLFATAIGTPVGIRSARFGLVFTFSNRIITTWIYTHCFRTIY